MREKLENLLENLKTNNDVRKSLSEIRVVVRDEKAKDASITDDVSDLFCDNIDLLGSFLQSDEPKIRKNAALLIGELSLSSLVPQLFDAYKKETTMFVRFAYLDAIYMLDSFFANGVNVDCTCANEYRDIDNNELSSKEQRNNENQSDNEDNDINDSGLNEKEDAISSTVSITATELLGKLEARKFEISATELSDENRKHLTSELKSINQILIKYKGIKKHTPVLKGLKGEKTEVLLITNRLHREVVRKQLAGKPTKLHPLGVLVKTDDIEALFSVRTFRSLCFPIHVKELLVQDPNEAAKQLWESDLLKLLKSLNTEPGAFYYRIDCSANSDYISKVTKLLDQLSSGELINSPSDYEITIKLFQNKQGLFFPCMIMGNIVDKRFAYRKNVLPTSMHPSTAALLMEIAWPYLKEGAQVMDPFCGVGTLLVERDALVPAGDMYATDVYGDAIKYGRENIANIKREINFIHRDFFDFKHDYKFDEIVTDMPIRGKRTKEQMDELYARFFNKLPEILAPNAVIVMYSNEIGFVKKQLRLHSEYELMQETCILDKKNFYLFVIKFHN